MNTRTVKTDEFTITSGHLNVSNGHQIWFEQWGNPEAKIPILVFHGGPGSEFKPKHKYSFNPKKHQIISFDQRGSGNSLPYGSIDHNTTQDLLDDTRKILRHLNISKVHVNGGSWGSTLALLFAIENPEFVETIIVRGIFTGTQAEIDWLDKGVFKNHYPEVWERFVASVPKEHQGNPAAYHYRVIESNTSENLEATSQALSDLEIPIMMFDWRGFAANIKKDPDPNVKPEKFDPIPYKIYGHYFNNACFLEPEYIIKNADRITAPLYIVQGRYDMACPPITAYRLHKAASHSKLYMTLSSHGNDSETNTALKVLIDTVY